MDFISYICSLPAEGETALMVLQKPSLSGGELQLHADGAIKATWPAFKPGHKMKPGAWYGNTASFIVDRFTDGHVSASAANVPKTTEAQAVKKAILSDRAKPLMISASSARQFSFQPPIL